MNRDRLLGFLILAASIIGVVAFGWLLFFTRWALLALQITVFIAVAAVLAILGWIGYTLATTPMPKPIEEMEKSLKQSYRKWGKENKT